MYIVYVGKILYGVLKAIIHLVQFLVSLILFRSSSGGFISYVPMGKLFPTDLYAAFLANLIILPAIFSFI